MSGYAPETCIKHRLLSEHICTVAKSSAIKEQNASLEQETPKGFLFSARPVVISARDILVPAPVKTACLIGLEHSCAGQDLTSWPPNYKSYPGRLIYSLNLWLRL